jgi:hypothetical protein
LRLAGLTRDTYTPAEVRERLVHGDELDARTAAVRAAAAQTGVWSAHLDARAAADLGKSGRCLPLIVFWYCQGVPLEEIGRRISPFGSEWDADRALATVSRLIAQVLNTQEAVARSVA